MFYKLFFLVNYNNYDFGINILNSIKTNTKPRDMF